jgi:predicted amidophosphoribosyltransferase
LTLLLRLGKLARWKALLPLEHFVLPSACFVCGEALTLPHRMGACLACWDRFRPLAPPLCTGCGLPRTVASDLAGPARGRCAACIVSPREPDRVRAAVAYDELARRFLLRAKLGIRPELLRPLAEMVTVVVRPWVRPADGVWVVPVPSHPWMNLRRGFSPARAIARPLARSLGLELRTALLSRHLGSPVVVKQLRARQRRQAYRSMFRVHELIRGRRILLVDDVMTSGGTLDACARLLKTAGAVEVRAAVWARTLPLS